MLVTREQHYGLTSWAPEPFYDEQPARLLIEDGDTCISYTPTEDNAIGYYFDRIYERAKVYYKSNAIREYYLREHKTKFPEIEFTNSKESIAVIQMATDDNPLLTKDTIDRNTQDLTIDSWLICVGMVYLLLLQVRYINSLFQGYI